MELRIFFLIFGIFLPYVSIQFSQILASFLPSFFLIEVAQKILVTEKFHVLPLSSIEKATEPLWKDDPFVFESLRHENRSQVANETGNETARSQNAPLVPWFLKKSNLADLHKMQSEQMELEWKENEQSGDSLMFILDYFNAYGYLSIGRKEGEFSINAGLFDSGRPTWVTGIEMNVKGEGKCLVDAFLDIDEVSQSLFSKRSYYVFLSSDCFSTLVQSPQTNQTESQTPGQPEPFLLSFKMKKANIAPIGQSLTFIFFAISYFVPNFLIQLTDTILFFFKRNVSFHRASFFSNLRGFLSFSKQIEDISGFLGVPLAFLQSLFSFLADKFLRQMLLFFLRS